MLPGISAISGIAVSKYSPTYFCLPQIHSAICNYYAISKHAVNQIRAFQLPMQEINKSADILTSTDSLEKEICFFLFCGYSSSRLAYFLYI